MACNACGSEEQVKFDAELDLKIYFDPTRSALPVHVIRQGLLVCTTCGAIAPFFSETELQLLKQFGGSSSMWL